MPAPHTTGERKQGLPRELRVVRDGAPGLDAVEPDGPLADSLEPALLDVRGDAHAA
jgi:hypothetical protein